jgi:hypothetical protein
LTESIKKKISFISDTKFQSTELQQYFDAKRKNITGNIKSNEAASVLDEYEKMKMDILQNTVKIS